MKMKINITLTELGDIKSVCLNELKDWFPPGKFDKRYPQEYLKKWIRVNEDYLKFLRINFKWDDTDKKLILIPGEKIGVVPLKNPYGRNTYGNIAVKPRVGWLQIYEILNLINWKYQPAFLKEEEEIISTGTLPRWLKIVDTLEAIDQALSTLMRGLSRKETLSPVPIGTINWERYAKSNFSRAQLHYFDCMVSDYSMDFEIHRMFKGVLKIIESELFSALIPNKVMLRANQLIVKLLRILENIPSEEPSVKKLMKIQIPQFYKSAYNRAIYKCIEFLNQSKFSLEIGAYYGLPWSMEMNQLFEHWVEHYAYSFAKSIGAKFFSDIRNNSRIRFYNLKNWKSLGGLKPDIIIEKESKTLVIDVKYKKHLMYLQYGVATKEILDEHRGDIHQILSYLSSSTSEKRIGCLMYPRIHESLDNQYSSLINYTNTNINVDLILCGVPFTSNEVMNIMNEIWKEGYKYKI